MSSNPQRSSSPRPAPPRVATDITAVNPTDVILEEVGTIATDGARTLEGGVRAGAQAIQESARAVQDGAQAVQDGARAVQDGAREIRDDIQDTAQALQGDIHDGKQALRDEVHAVQDSARALRDNPRAFLDRQATSVSHPPHERSLTGATMYDPTSDVRAAAARVETLEEEGRAAATEARNFMDDPIASMKSAASRVAGGVFDRALNAAIRPRPGRSGTSERTAVVSVASDPEKEKQDAEIQEIPAENSQQPASATTAAASGAAPVQDESDFKDYVNLLFTEGLAPPRYNFLAGLSTWTLLGGFIVLPGTYTTLQQLQQQDVGNEETQKAINAFLHIPLFAVAWAFCGLGLFGMLWCWYRLRKSYVWLCDRLFWPGALNGLMGLLSTVVTIFSAQQGELAASGTTQISITGACMVLCAILGLFYTVKRGRQLRKQGRFAKFHLDGQGLVKAAALRMEEADASVKNGNADVEKRAGSVRNSIRRQVKSMASSSFQNSLQ